MSHNIVLYSLVKSTFALLLPVLDNETNVDENFEQLNLAKKLEDHIELLRSNRSGIFSNDLLTSLKHLKNAVVSLRTCFENLKDEARRSSAENSTSQNERPETESDLKEVSNASKDVPNDSQDPTYTAKYTELQKVVLEIEESKDFKAAMDSFLNSKKFSATVFENENERETKITATKVRVISEMLGNLTNLRGAAEKCMEYISELHEIFNLQKSPFSIWHKAQCYVKLEKWFESPGMVGLDSAMHINVVVFRFMKEFIRKPVAMLDWPTIDIAKEELYQETHHPILGEQPSKANTPDPFTAINHDKIDSRSVIDSQISAVNCSGDVFAARVLVKDGRLSASRGIMRITPSYHRRYGVDDEHKRKILSISIDCADCKTLKENATEPTSSQFNEATAQSSQASCKTSLHRITSVCKGKMYIIASNSQKTQTQYNYFLYVIDMDEKIHQTEKLGFLESTQLLEPKIFCIRDEKMIILDVIGRLIYICENNGKNLKTIDIKAVTSSAQLDNVDFPRPPIFTISYNGTIVCCEERSKVNVYNIDEEGNSLKKTNEVALKHVVQTVAFNHDSISGDETIMILCKTSVRLQYHLVTYTKAGELKQDIKLGNGDYQEAKLIFHPSGPVVLLDKRNLLHLK